MSQYSGPQFLSVTGVCEQYSLSRKTVYRLIDAGKLEATYLTPRALRVSVASMNKLVQDGAALPGQVL